MEPAVSEIKFIVRIFRGSLGVRSDYGHLSGLCDLSFAWMWNYASVTYQNYGEGQKDGNTFESSDPVKRFSEHSQEQNAETI